MSLCGVDSTRRRPALQTVSAMRFHDAAATARSAANAAGSGSAGADTCRRKADGLCLWPMVSDCTLALGGDIEAFRVRQGRASSAALAPPDRSRESTWYGRGGVLKVGGWAGILGGGSA